LFENWQNDQRRGIFSPDEDGFSQAYCMYVKKNPQSMAEKDSLLGVSTIFKHSLITNKTMKLLYWGRLGGPGGEAACDAVHTFPARRNKKLFKVFYQKTV